MSFVDIPDHCDDSGAMLQRGVQDLGSTMQEMLVTAEICRKQATVEGPTPPPPPEEEEPERTDPPDPNSPDPGDLIVDTGGGGSEEEDETVNGLPSVSGPRVPADPFDHNQLLSDGKEDIQLPDGNPTSSALSAGGGGGGGLPGGGGGGGSGGGEPYGDREVAAEDPTKGLLQGFGGSKGFGGYGGGVPGGSGYAAADEKKDKEVVEKSAEVDLKDLFKKPKVHMNPVMRKMGGPHENIFEIIKRRYAALCARKALDCGDWDVGNTSRRGLSSGYKDLSAPSPIRH